MQLTEKEYKRCLLLKIDGRIDHETAMDLEKALDNIFKKRRYQIVVDLSGVDYISSAGLHTLVSALKKTRRRTGGDVRLAALTSRLKEGFSLVGFDQLFQTYEEVSDAVGSF
ncbi:MAG: STAS domain-containing protein [Anaerolineales bacterium]